MFSIFKKFKHKRKSKAQKSSDLLNNNQIILKNFTHQDNHREQIINRLIRLDKGRYYDKKAIYSWIKTREGKGQTLEEIEEMVIRGY